MSFISFSFAIFLLITFSLYFLVPRKYQWVVALTASYVFYLFASVPAVIFIIFTTLSTFGAGLAMGKANAQYNKKLADDAKTLTSEQKKLLKSENKKRKHTYLVIALLLNFGILAVIKYGSLFIDSANQLFQFASLDLSIPGLELLLPLGISFYTFQSAGYLIDIYRGKISPDRNLPKFALFVSFFPQIVQGPISRYDELAGQLTEPHEFEYNRAKYGLQLILWGLFKKLMIADRIAVMVDTVFNDYTPYTGITLLAASLFYCIQLYCDFSGGIDIARGAAQVMGIHLTNNFERPFFATSIADFWRRWHITLGRWMREYIFYPLSLSPFFAKIGRLARKVLGNSLGRQFPAFLATVITFLIIGIWHGANWKYAVYGLYNGGLICLGILLHPLLTRWFTQENAKIDGFGWRVMKILGTNFLIVVGRIITRAPDLIVARRMIRRSFLNFNPWVFTDSTFTSLGLDAANLALLAGALLVLLIVGILQENGFKLREEIAKQNIVFRWGVYLLAVTSILIFGMYGIEYDAADFIYMGF